MKKEERQKLFNIDGEKRNKLYRICAFSSFLISSFISLCFQKMTLFHPTGNGLSFLILKQYKSYKNSTLKNKTERRQKILGRTEDDDAKKKKDY